MKMYKLSWIARDASSFEKEYWVRYIEWHASRPVAEKKHKTMKQQRDIYRGVELVPITVPTTKGAVVDFLNRQANTQIIEDAGFAFRERLGC